PSLNSSLILAHTVYSVGPYALIILLPLPHSLTTWLPHASPATTIVSNDGNLSASCAASNDGGRVATVTSFSLINSINPAPHLPSAPLPITSVAPDTSAVNISDTDASKLSDANCSTRLARSIPNRSLCASTRFPIPPCSTSTPFGSPVVP